MIPVLYECVERNFDNNGIGYLSDAISCEVTWEANGILDLEMVYPEGGELYNELTDKRIIYATPTPYKEAQPFEIVDKIENSDGTITVYANHVVYGLMGVPVLPFSASTVADAIAGIKANAAIPCEYEFMTDKEMEANFSVKVPTPAWNLLGGTSGSILDTYGGEYEFDGYTVKLHNKLGQDNGVEIRYGKNLISLEQERNMSNLYTGVLGYWSGQDGTVVYSDPKVTPVPGEFEHNKVLTVDFTQEWQEKPTQEQIKSRTERYIRDNKVGEPKVSIKVSHEMLEQTDEYSYMKVLEKLNVFDEVTVVFEKYNINAKAKIVKSVTDVMNDRYKSLNIGSVRASIADSIVSQEKEIQSKPWKPDVESVGTVINDIAKKIVGAKGGSKVDIFDGEKTAGTMYLNTDSVDTATNVLFLNHEGIAFSTSGINGPWTQAIGIDGTLANQWIQTWRLDANIITAGILQSKNGKSSWNLDTGVISVSSERTYRHTDYSDTDSERLRNVVLGYVAATPEDYDKYDFYKDGRLNNTDRALLRNMIYDKKNLTVKWVCTMSPDNPFDLLKITATNVGTGSSDVIFSIGSQNRLNMKNGDNLSTVGLLDNIYPVGSIYVRTGSSSPEGLFGGTWELRSSSNGRTEWERTS